MYNQRLYGVYKTVEKTVKLKIEFTSVCVKVARVCEDSDVVVLQLGMYVQWWDRDTMKDKEEENEIDNKEWNRRSSVCSKHVTNRSLKSNTIMSQS